MCLPAGLTVLECECECMRLSPRIHIRMHDKFIIISPCLSHLSLTPFHLSLPSLWLRDPCVPRHTPHVFPHFTFCGRTVGVVVIVGTRIHHTHHTDTHVHIVLTDIVALAQVQNEISLNAPQCVVFGL